MLNLRLGRSAAPDRTWVSAAALHPGPVRHEAAEVDYAIEISDRWEPGYWVARGWDREGRMKATSVVDAVDTGTSAVDASGGRLASIGGIAHAGARRISRVEVRLDEREWREARLRDPLSTTTWIVWRADLPLETGDHLVTVRSFEEDGAPQSSPYHSKPVKRSS